MSVVPTWVGYSIARLIVFAIPFVVLMLLGLVWWLSAIVAAIVGFCVSYIFFKSPRENLAKSLQWKKAQQNSDSAVEDAALDSSENESERESGT